MQQKEPQASLRAESSARDRYRDLFHAAPVAYFTLGPDATVRDVNLAGAGMLGLTAEDIKGRDFLRFLGKEQRRELSAVFDNPPDKEETRVLRLHLKLRGGRSISAQAVISAGEPVAGQRELRLVLSDLSAHRMLEDQRDMFFSIASHELRTPLTNISLSLDMLLQQSASRLDEDIRKTLEVARRGTRRLRRLVDEILRLRDVRTGLSPGPVDVIDLPPLVREAVQANLPFATDYGVELELQDQDGSLQVLGNGDRLIQVMNNLLSNAVKHSPEGGRIQVRLERQNGLARVSVSDQGSGVPPHLRERIFQPFTQGNPSLEDERHKGSMGLGLSIGRAIVEQMGGRLDFVSRPGVLTTFYFEIPETSL